LENNVKIVIRPKQAYISVMLTVSIRVRRVFSGGFCEDSNLYCKIWGFHGGDYEECRLLGCGAV
jgi:hypothetical protein